MEDAVKDPSKPFFLYQAFSHMHVPISHHPNFTHSSDSQDQIEHGSHFGDALRELDHHIGRVIDAVDRLGVADNTLILFTGGLYALPRTCH